MTVGIKVDFLWFPIGTGDFFHSFFSTVCVNLEDMSWGSRFPILMNEMYQGELPKEKLEIAQKELHEIKLEMGKISPEKVVWDVENLQKSPPWGTNISKEIANLAEYFVTSDGKNLIDILNESISEAIIENVNLEVKDL